MACKRDSPPGDIELDVSQAVPIGFILNEAVTNSIKYAFNTKKEGLLEVVFSRIDFKQLLLLISDDGIGLPSNFELGKNDSIGFTLIRTLTEQIGSSLQLYNDGRLKIRIIFVKTFAVRNSMEHSLFK